MRSEFSTDFVRDMDPVLGEHYTQWLPYCRESIAATIDELAHPDAFPRTLGIDNGHVDRDLLHSACVAPFRSYLRRSGKMLRPYLVCLCLEAYGRDPRTRPREVALAEIIHSSSLILDDVADDSTYRRGDLTAHQQVGMLVAGAVGSEWLNLGFEVVWRDRESLGSRITSRLIEELAWEHFVTGLGTTVDCIWPWQEKTNCLPGEYLQQVVHRSTSYTYRLPLKIGGLTADVPESEVAKLSAFGEQVGLGFQIVDDLLNVKPADEHWGKEVAEDIVQGKLTLQVILALERAEGARRARLLEILRSGTHVQSELQEAVGVLEETGALEECRRLATELRDGALKIADDLGMDEIYRRRLKALACYVLRRTR